MTEYDLAKIAKMFSEFRGVTLQTLSLEVADDGKFFGRLLGGKTCTLRRANDILDWFSDHWPDAELSWPDDIPRPPKNRKEAA